jgi:chromosomal replication initiator protein
MIFVSDIQAMVAQTYGVPSDIMVEPDGTPGARSPKHSEPRSVAMTLSARLTEHGAIKIGRLFGGRDHTTVGYAINKIETAAVTDLRLRDTMRRITLELIRKENQFG